MLIVSLANLNLNILEFPCHIICPCVEDVEEVKILKVPTFTSLFIKSADPQDWSLLVWWFHTGWFPDSHTFITHQTAEENGEWRIAVSP